MSKCKEYFDIITDELAKQNHNMKLLIRLEEAHKLLIRETTAEALSAFNEVVEEVRTTSPDLNSKRRIYQIYGDMAHLIISDWIEEYGISLEMVNGTVRSNIDYETFDFRWPVNRLEISDYQRVEFPMILTRVQMLEIKKVKEVVARGLRLVDLNMMLYGVSKAEFLRLENCDYIFSDSLIELNAPKLMLGNINLEFVIDIVLGGANLGDLIIPVAQKLIFTAHKITIKGNLSCSSALYRDTIKPLINAKKLSIIGDLILDGDKVDKSML